MSFVLNLVIVTSYKLAFKRLRKCEAKLFLVKNKCKRKIFLTKRKIKVNEKNLKYHDHFF